MRNSINVQELYDEFPFPLVGNHRNFVQRYLVPNLPPSPIAILDAGCGTGNLTLDLARLYPRATVMGVDFSENALANARQLAAQAGLRTEFRWHDLLKPMHGEDALYDVVVAIGCIHHTEDPLTALRNLARVLAPDGLLIVAVYGKYGRIETEMRRSLMVHLRSVTGKNNRELQALCRLLLAEEVVRLNRYQKQHRPDLLTMVLRHPRRLLLALVRRIGSRLGFRERGGVPADIAVADQYLNPIVHNWTAAQWYDTVVSSGLAVERFVTDPENGGLCFPHNPVRRLHHGELRAVIEAMPPKVLYETLDLIYRPAMHIIICRKG